MHCVTKQMHKHKQDWCIIYSIKSAPKSMSLETKKLQQAKELLDYFLLFRVNVNDIKDFCMTFTNYNFYVEKFVFKDTNWG